MTRHSPLSRLLLFGVLIGSAAGCKDPDPTFVFDGSASDGSKDEATGGDAVGDGHDAAGEDRATDAPDAGDR